MTASTLIAATWSEASWWSRALLRAVRRFPGQVAVILAIVWICPVTMPVNWAIGCAAVAAVARVWARSFPVSFQRLVAGPVQRLWWRWWIRRRWSNVAAACGLGVETRRTFQASRSADRLTERVRVTVPCLLNVRARGPRLLLRVRPVMGQTVDEIVGSGERLRTAVGATRVRTDPLGPNEALVTLTMGDTLAAPFKATYPASTEPPETASVLLGRSEDGSDWRLPIGPHTLVAGCSGAGKGSVFWSFAFGLAPAVRAGIVRLHGIDLKGGMEILMGADLYSHRATSAAQAVALLEQLVEKMQKRTRAYAGRVRSHTPTVDEPLHVVMVDELAALTAYCPQRDLQRRAEMAISMLCSQGRAPGFVVFACLQDPRKEVIPSRGLFTQMVGLRLKDLNETSMVLGETAVASGAHCHRITTGTPGMGYVLPEDGGYPIRVRAGYVSDHAIRSVATEFATPFHETVTVPESAENELRAGRRSRSRSREVA